MGVPTSQPSVFQIAIKTEKDKTESKKENEREKKEMKEKREARKENEKLSATKSDVIVIVILLDIFVLCVIVFDTYILEVCSLVNVWIFDCNTYILVNVISQ